MTSPEESTRKRKGIDIVKNVAEETVASSVIASSPSKPPADFSRFRHALSPGKVKLEAPSPTRRSSKAKKEQADEGGCHIKEEVVEVSRAGGATKLERHSDDDGGYTELVTTVVDTTAPEGGCEALLKVVDDLVVALAPLTFTAPVAMVYNPLEYARKPHENYVRKYGGKKVDFLLVGMNPGPFGMAQTGVPFGDCVLVRKFLKITGEVQTPQRMHPKRPILGFNCTRHEVSGQRLWGWAQARFGTADAFFDRFWIHNYCPLMFIEPSGKNRTPDKLTVSERASVVSACNVALRSVIAVLQPRVVVGIGKYAGERVKECAAPGTQVGDIMHPSPANPKANKDWDKLIEVQLQALGVDI